MAARKRRGVNELPDDWKLKIKASQIANRLFACFNGEVALERTQIEAGKILFSKMQPDLARQELTGKDGKELNLSGLVESSLRKE